ncbi:hypothetical protein LY76DRAFT_644958 [Colletotrichum caudatum]|nr:hypothetical protein LY76DRAFT_644958 [Colletotrichum caudatum]
MSAVLTPHRKRLPWADLVVRSFFGGVSISLGSLSDLVVAGVATVLAAFAFPVGFVLVVLASVELVTSNMAVMTCSTLQRKTTWYDLARNWVTSYVFNPTGCKLTQISSVNLGYQHSVANFFLVPIGMFYGTNFGFGKFIYRSAILNLYG